MLLIERAVEECDWLLARVDGCALLSLTPEFRQLTNVIIQGNTSAVPKIRCGGYIFFTWKGDHAPRHVHVYRDEKLVVKWDSTTGSR